MKIPGFTAEASLEKAGNQYIVARQSTGGNNRDEIIPQARVLEGFCFRNFSYCCFKNPNGTLSCGRTIST